MTQRERQILRWIEENPLISQQELADKAGIARSSVAVHISNLMKKGHIAGKGYIVSSAPYAVVVGGVNMDIGGVSAGPLVPADSNPGAVRMSLGGVGRNIAHNMALLGVDTRLLTAFGADRYAQRIANQQSVQTAFAPAIFVHKILPAAFGVLILYLSCIHLYIHYTCKRCDYQLIYAQHVNALLVGVTALIILLPKNAQQVYTICNRARLVSLSCSCAARAPF